MPPVANLPAAWHLAHAHASTRRKEQLNGCGRRTAAVGRETAVVGRETAAVGRETAAVGHETAAVGRETAAVGHETAVVGHETGLNARYVAWTQRWHSMHLGGMA
jgi:hypothetical protein